MHTPTYKHINRLKKSFTERRNTGKPEKLRKGKILYNTQKNLTFLIKVKMLGLDWTQRWWEL